MSLLSYALNNWAQVFKLLLSNNSFLMMYRSENFHIVAIYNLS